MKNNKKILIPIIIIVVVIILAVIGIVLVKVIGKNSDTKNQPVSFSNDVTSNTTEEPGNSSEEIPEFYKKAIEQLAAGMINVDEMDKFINNYFDPKAFVAYQAIAGDDAKLMEQYSKVTDEEAKKVTDDLKKYSTTLQMISGLANVAQSNLSNTTQNEVSMEPTNATETNEVSNNTENTNQTLDDLQNLKIEVVKIENLQKSEVDENITQVEATLSMAGDEQKCTVVFYGEIVIYVSDSDGKSILDSNSFSNSNELNNNTTENTTTENTVENVSENATENNIENTTGNTTTNNVENSLSNENSINMTTDNNINANEN